MTPEILTWRELRDLVALECAVPAVVARQVTRKGHGFTIVERLYEFSNGAALGARRGGPLHLADEDTWEIFMLNTFRTRIGDSVGWITSEHLDRLVAHYADLVVMAACALQLWEGK